MPRRATPMARTLHQSPPHGRFPRAQAGKFVSVLARPAVPAWRRDALALLLDRLPREQPMTLQPTPAGAAGGSLDVAASSISGPPAGAGAAGAVASGIASSVTAVMKGAWAVPAALGTASATAVTAAAPAASFSAAAAIGATTTAATGIAGRLLVTAERLPVSLSRAERRSCEDGFVQRALWPLFHDLAPLATFDLADWPAFRAVN